MARHVPPNSIATNAITNNDPIIEVADLDFKGCDRGKNCLGESHEGGSENGESERCFQHPNIRSYLGVLRCQDPRQPFGRIRFHVLDKLAMDAIGVNTMWEETQAYDALHPEGMMDKVDNFVSNEEFPPKRERNFREAHSIVFIENVWLHPDSRGHGRSLHAVRMALLKVGVPNETVVLLQAGSMEETQMDVTEANERLTAHWKKLGFEPWSPSDDAWLCLSLEDEIHGLGAMRTQAAG